MAAGLALLALESASQATVPVQKIDSAETQLICEYAVRQENLPDQG
jgi:hypothetical protein